MDTMPSAYETTYEGTHTAPAASEGPPPIGLNQAYIHQIPAILKITQIAINFVILITAGASYYSYEGSGGFVSFVAGITFFVTLIIFLLYLINVIYRLPPQRVLGEMIVIVVCAALHLIAFIVSVSTTHGRAGPIICAILTIANTVIYAVECYLRFRVYREGGAGQSISTHHTTATTTTVTHVDKGPAYSVP